MQSESTVTSVSVDGVADPVLPNTGAADPVLSPTDATNPIPPVDGVADPVPNSTPTPNITNPSSTQINPKSINNDPDTTYNPMGQNGTEWATLKPTLKPSQQLALQLLAQGLTDSEVARQIGVHRHTVNRWKLYHPVFQTQLNQLRQSIWQEAADKLRALLNPALDILKDRLQSTNDKPAQFRAAVQTLKISGISKAVHRIGPTGLDDLLEDRYLARKRKFHKIGPECNMYPPDHHDLLAIEKELINHVEREEPNDPPVTAVADPVLPNPAVTDPLPNSEISNFKSEIPQMPIEIPPKPTELVQVGIVLTEFAR
jgi:hypothetical protein